MTNNITKIGITGNIGSGKSTVAKIFEDYGFNYLDADKAIHAYYKQGHQVYGQVVDQFGRSILDSNEEIDRTELGHIVFSDPEKLKQLEIITHTELRKQLNNLPDKPVNIIEGALIFEKGFQKYFDKNILVYIPKHIAKQRAMERGNTKKDFERRWKIQMDPDEKKKYADFVIHNSGSLNFTKLQVGKFIRKNVPEYL